MGGGEVTCPGGQGVFDPWWGRLIKALTCPGGRGGSDSMCVLGVEGSEKKWPPRDNFWNSPKQQHPHSSIVNAKFYFSQHTYTRSHCQH